MEQPRSGVYDPRSTGEFQAWFRTDADYLEWLRWPGGFTCPDGGHAGGWRLGDGRLECTACHGRTSYGTPQPPRREGKTGWRDTGSQAGRPRVQAGACLGDISPFWVSEGGLGHRPWCCITETVMYHHSTLTRHGTAGPAFRSRRAAAAPACSAGPGMYLRKQRGR